MKDHNDTPLVKIGVIGVGGAGGNAVNRMMQERRAEVGPGTVFNTVMVMAANTDTQDLDKSAAEQRIQLGPQKTHGFGAGADPSVGCEAAEESRVEIANHLDGLDMLFITAGMGGGTGTGAAPVIAEVARSAGVLTVGVVTTPFFFEGRKKMRIAQEGLEKLRAQVDTLVVIPNEKLVSIADDRATCDEMFLRSDEVLINAVGSLADLIANQATIHVDFADVRTTMVGMGSAVIGIGAAAGENAALNAVQEALNNPLLSDISIKGARRALLHFSGMRMPMKELQTACQHVSEQLHEDASFIWGIANDDAADKVSVLIVAEAMQQTASHARRAEGAQGKSDLPRGAAPGTQSSLFDMGVAQNAVATTRQSASAQVRSAAPKEPVSTERVIAEPVPVVAAAKTVVKEAMPTVDLSEKVLFHLPEDMPPDPNDMSVPTIVRQMMRKQMEKEAKGRSVPPAPESERSAGTPAISEETGEHTMERVTVGANGKKEVNDKNGHAAS